MMRKKLGKIHRDTIRGSHFSVSLRSPTFFSTASFEAVCLGLRRWCRKRNPEPHFAGEDFSIRHGECEKWYQNSTKTYFSSSTAKKVTSKTRSCKTILWSSTPPGSFFPSSLKRLQSRLRSSVFGSLVWRWYIWPTNCLQKSVSIPMIKPNWNNLLTRTLSLVSFKIRIVALPDSKIFI